jgi:hypothetical protein
MRDEELHLARLLEAAERCGYYMQASAGKLPWPLTGEALYARRKDTELFEAAAAFNERFSKLQDTLGAAMRHAALQMGEATSPFLRVLALFQKLGVIECAAMWQRAREARNLAAHDYDTDYAVIAEHFNQLNQLRPALLATAARLLRVCDAQLGIHPSTGDFSAEFKAALAELDTPSSSPSGDA